MQTILVPPQGSYAGGQVTLPALVTGSPTQWPWAARLAVTQLDQRPAGKVLVWAT